MIKIYTKSCGMDMLKECVITNDSRLVRYDGSDGMVDGHKARYVTVNASSSLHSL